MPSSTNNNSDPGDNSLTKEQKQAEKALRKEERASLRQKKEERRRLREALSAPGSSGEEIEGATRLDSKVKPKLQGGKQRGNGIAVEVIIPETQIDKAVTSSPTAQRMTSKTTVKESKLSKAKKGKGKPIPLSASVVGSDTSEDENRPSDMKSRALQEESRRNHTSATEEVSTHVSETVQSQYSTRPKSSKTKPVVPSTSKAGSTKVSSLPKPKTSTPAKTTSQVNPFQSERRNGRPPTEKISDEGLRQRFVVPGRMDEYLASGWIHVNELKRLEEAGGEYLPSLTAVLDGGPGW
jgi:hypothetical protein